MSPIHDITRLLRDSQEGDREAFDWLLPLVYAELRKIAAGHMSRQNTGHTLQPTALLHEAYIRHLLLGTPKLVRPVLDPVMPVAEEGDLPKISQSLLVERIAVYALLVRAAARAGDRVEAKRWKEKFDGTIQEAARRALGGPYPADRQKEVEADWKRAGLR